MLSVYSGHTLFSIFSYCSKVYETILMQLNKRIVEESKESNKNGQNDLLSRRLYKILSLPVSENHLIFKDELC